MCTTRTEGTRISNTPHPRAAIVFGSAASDPSVKRASVRATCDAIGLARSTYYYQSHRSTPAMELEHKIVLRLHELRESFPEAGYRRMTQQLQLEGFQINRKRIARLMQLHGLTLRPVRSHVEQIQYHRAPSTVANLWQTVRLTRPHQAWIADIAYVRIGSGLVYAAAIIDAWTREVVGYAVSTQINTRLASIALHAAVRAHRPAPGSVHHSNCGTQYTMRGYTDLLRQYGLIPSAGDAAAEQAAPLRVSCESSRHPRHVVEMNTYQTWEQVSGNVREFIQTLYSPARVVGILGRESADVSLRACEGLRTDSGNLACST
jgi:putative transposase